jgi:hypothetical protein
MVSYSWKLGTCHVSAKPKEAAGSTVEDGELSVAEWFRPNMTKYGYNMATIWLQYGYNMAT